MTGVLGELSTVVAVEHAETVVVSGFWTDPLQPSPRIVGSKVTSCADAGAAAAPAAAVLEAVGFASPPFR